MNNLSEKIGEEVIEWNKTMRSDLINVLELDDNQKQLFYWFQDRAICYMNGDISVDFLKDWISQNVSFEVDDNGFSLPTQQCLIVASHPYLSKECRLMTKDIVSSQKGTNDFGFSYFHFRVLRDMLMEKILAGISHKTVITPIGYSVANKELHSLELPIEKWVDYCVDYLFQNPAESLVIFPEWGYKKWQEFRSWFFHIAKSAWLKKIVLVWLSDQLSIFTQNKAKVVDVLDFDENADPDFYAQEVWKKIFSDKEKFHY